MLIYHLYTKFYKNLLDISEVMDIQNLHRFFKENIAEMNQKSAKIPVFFRSYVNIDKLPNPHLCLI